MWFWYSEVGEEKHSSWNFLFPHSLTDALACSCVNAVTRPIWSISQRTTVTIEYVTCLSYKTARPAQNKAKKQYCWYHSETGIPFSQRRNSVSQLDWKCNTEKTWADFPWSKTSNSGMPYKHMFLSFLTPVLPCHQRREWLKPVTARETKTWICSEAALNFLQWSDIPPSDIH